MFKSNFIISQSHIFKTFQEREAAEKAAAEKVTAETATAETAVTDVSS